MSFAIDMTEIRVTIPIFFSFSRKLVRLKKSSIGERLELRPRADVLSAIYFNDLEMGQYMINHPKELIISRQDTLAPKETIKWSEYLQQPCTLFEEVGFLVIFLIKCK